MEMNFKELLMQGESAANEIVRNHNEIETVLRELEKAISEHIKIMINLHSTPQIEQTLPNLSKEVGVFASLLSPKKETGFEIMSLHHDETSIDKPIFLMKKSENGYPVTVVHNKKEITADSQEDLTAALGIIIADPKTIFKLRSFSNEVHNVRA